MLAVRCRKDHRINRWIGQDLIEIVFQGNSVFTTECLSRVAGSGIARSEADRAALALHRIDQCPTPPADANDSGSDHASPPMSRDSPDCSIVEQFQAPQTQQGNREGASRKYPTLLKG